MTPEPTGREVRMEAYASGSGTIYLAAGNQNIAGRDLHLHYWDGTHRVDRVQPGQAAGDECPYPGMSAFGVEQSRWYFGRDALRARLTAGLDDCLREGGALAVVADSGAGKSSLLRAGLAPDLARGALPGSRHWPCLILTPTAQPVAALTTHLAGLTGVEPEVVRRELVHEPDALAVRLSASLAERRADRLVVVVDQAEELFTLVTDETERTRFTDALDRLARAQGPALVVYGLRADFYGHALRYRPLRQALERRQVAVGPMDRTELREAIVFPARSVGLELEEGLVELLLTDLGATTGTREGYEAGRLPHLAHALRLTWQQRQGSTMTVERYTAIGGIHEAVARSAEAAFQALDPLARTAAEVMLRRLVRIGEKGDDDTRRTVPTARLTQGLERRAAEAVLAGFTERRLLTRLRDVRQPDTQWQDTVTLTHEALLRAWPRLHGWLHTGRAASLLRQQIEDDAAAWASDRDRAHLYRGSRLAKARAWAAGPGHDGLGPPVSDFLDASVRLARRTAVLLRGAVAVVVVSALLAVGGALVAQSQSRRADQERAAAEAQRLPAVARTLRAKAESLRDSDPRRSLRLGLAAQRVAPTTEGRQGLVTMLQQTRFDGASADAALGPVDGLATFFQSGTLLVTAAPRAGSVTLWDTVDPLRPRRLATLTGLRDKASAVSLSPDGRRLAVVTEGDGRAPVHELSLWDLTDRAHPLRLPFRAGVEQVADCAFSPDGRTLAVVAGGGDGTLTLWDIGDPASPRRLSAPTAATDAGTVRFSADGRTLVTAAGLATASPSFGPDSIAHFSGWQLWDVRDARRPRAVFHERGFTEGTLAVSTTSPVLAVGSGHKLALWDFGDPASPRRTAVLQHPTRVAKAAFRPDGRRVVTLSDGQRTQLWDVTDPARPVGPSRLSGPGKPVAFAFSGDHVVMADESGSLSRWRVALRSGLRRGAALPSGDVSLSSVAFSPDGRRLAAGGFGGDVHLWDTTDPARPRALPPLRSTSGQPVETVAFNRDGTALAAGTIADADSARGEIVLWDVSDTDRPRRRAVLATPTGVTSLAFNPRTATLAASGTTNMFGSTWVALWDTSTTVPRRSYLEESLNRLLDETDDPAPVVPRHLIAATPTVFSPDGRLLALSGSLWNVTDPAAPVRVRQAERPPGDHRSTPSALLGMAQADFSPDGRRLAAESVREDGVDLWPVGPVIGTDPVGSVPARKPVRVVHHPAGHLLATAEEHGAVQLWDIFDPARPALAATLEDPVVDARFAPDGRTLALIPEAGDTVGLWHLGDLPRTLADVTGLACRIVGAGLSEDAWKKDVPGVPYQDTCAG
ncbi:WD40 repeat domain-containing protein [Streptomyces sp. NPDC053755]|uniref:WD40 repeat domain-containing protein n=1 Tax=Streptomyces sp. NPDC053755 TaxID=3155815 RepID=UPI00341EB0BA